MAIGLDTTAKDIAGHQNLPVGSPRLGLEFAKYNLLIVDIRFARPGPIGRGKL